VKLAEDTWIRQDIAWFQPLDFDGHDDHLLAMPKSERPDPANAGARAGVRRKAVDQAREGWIRRLIDLSRRNNLLYYRDLKSGTVDLSAADPEAMVSFLHGEPVTLTRILPDADQVVTNARLQEIRRRALGNLEEKGLDTLFVAMGMASWRPADEGRPSEAAVLLVPAEVTMKGREGRSPALRRKGEIQVNLSLLHVLETEYGISIDPEALLRVLQGDDAGEAFDPTPVYDMLSAAAREVNDFTVRPRIVVGNFAFQKTAMVRDLQEFGPEMAGHDLIAAIAGDTEARDAVHASRVSADPREVDQIPPEAEFLVLDADSSQQRVILQAARGQDGVVQGPPGTGKSQTIVNLIAESAAQGRKILFVAEKRAALEVVLDRLKHVGLEHLALDLHGAEISRKQFAAKIAASLSHVRESPQVDFAALHRRFSERRRRLNEHVARLHTPQIPSGLSVYEMQGRLVGLPVAAQVPVRWRGADLERLDRRSAESILDLLTELQGFRALFCRDASSPWSGAPLQGGEQVQTAIDLVRRLLPNWRESKGSLARAVADSGLAEPHTAQDAVRLTTLLSDVAATSRMYPDRIYSEDLISLTKGLRPAEGGVIRRAWASVTNPNYRRAVQRLKSLRREKPRSAALLKGEADAALDQVQRWSSLGSNGTAPQVIADAHRLLNGMIALMSDLDLLGGMLGRAGLATMDRQVLDGLLEGLAADPTTPHRIPRLLAMEREIEAFGAGALLPELRDTSRPPEAWPRCFEFAWLSSCLDRVRLDDPTLGAFDGRTHDQLVREFRELDRERIKLAAQRVRRTHAEAVIAVMNAKREQATLVRAEAARKSRHMPIRKLLSEAPDVLTTLLPCWMASPLSVSHLLPANQTLFDIVLFDEASQVLPEDAVTSLLRGKHAIVAGDQKQLPPTTFFLVGGDQDEDADEASPTQGFESILDQLSAFLEPWTLDWHYRSRDEALIAFSNRHIYGDRLVTFPGPTSEPVVSLVLVASVPDQDGQEDSTSAEVRKVVELVLKHAEEHPNETLGVIALGIAHARRVEAAVEEALRARPDLDSFFDQSRAERFFVKNLERVQGDERDAIILTVGYGKDRSGRLLYRFGPLLSEGGERRLNVAITRARVRMTVVSAFSHHDMDPGRSKARGVELLRLYLEYAASGGKRLGQSSAGEVPLNEFEQDVYDALTARGVALLPQWGVSRYRIDLVVKHPTEPGRLVLAIECDGATYHSAQTARDRDRLRQQHLEALGWRFHRIWSTDWFLRRESEIERTLAAVRIAFERSGAAQDEATSGQPRPDGTPAGESASAPKPAPSRGPRPELRDRPSIVDYKPDELVSLVAWIQSDGVLRTDDEILSEAVSELGFDRLGSRIEATLRVAIDSWRTWDTKRRRWS